MVWISFLVALVLLALALYFLRLDARQRGGVSRREAPAAVAAEPVGERTETDDDELTPTAPPGEVERPQPDPPGSPQLAPFQRTADSSGHGPEDGPDGDDPVPEARPVAPEESGEPVDAGVDVAAETAADPAPASSPRLLDRVRRLLPARRQRARLPEPVAAQPVDPLAGSLVVRWLEDRAFEPTPTPAPEFRHGDFAGGLSALGTVSHGMFRGRRAIMGVTGGRTVLALRRDTASDVVLDLSRPDVDAEPGFHDAGEVAALEARTSDYGRLDLLDRERLTSAVRDVPAPVRRIWAEGEWVAATVDGTDDPSTWDDVVVALNAAADVFAPFPPIGGRARALPAEIDPGAPGAAAGPEADPTVGMDGEVGTGTHGVAPVVTVSTEATVVDPAGAAATAAQGPGELDPEDHHPDGSAEPRRAGHLHLVPARMGARDLSDAAVVADRGDRDPDPEQESAQTSEDSTEPDAGIVEETPVAEEPDPFGDVMEPTGPVAARGDVAADFLEPRPPLSRPTRGAGQAYPEDASVPPLAAGVTTGGAGIRPLGSEDDADEIRTEVERFDAARTDGGSDLDTGSGGRHAQPSEDQTPAWLRPGVTPVPPRAGSGKHRRADADEEQDSDSGRERPGVEPDVEQTTRIEMPPDIRD